MTNFLLLIGAGLFSRGIWAFQENAFNHLLGADVDDSGGDGPGSFNVVGNIWHLDCCNPENNFDSSGWSIFNAIFGWTNSATLGSILSYIFYWIAVMVTLVIMKYREVLPAINVLATRYLTIMRRVGLRSSDANLLLVALVAFAVKMRPSPTLRRSRIQNRATAMYPRSCRSSKSKSIPFLR